MNRNVVALALFTLSLTSLPDGGDAASAKAPAPARRFTRELPEDVREQAQAAFVADAYRREERFRAAAGESADPFGLRAPGDVLDRPLADVFDRGGRLFAHTWLPEEGYGAKDLPTVGRFHKGRRGGPDARACASCHARGGPAGGGDASDNAYFDGDGETQESAFGRNPKALVGAGVVEILAREMTAALQVQRDEAIREGKKSSRPVKKDLVTKGVSFGWLVVKDGTVDTSHVAGVDADLVVKPFGWKGTFGDLRSMVEESLLVHHGIQSTWLVAHGEPARIGTFGKDDPDGDGVKDEIDEGQVDALTLWVAMQEIPTVSPPKDGDQLALYAKGRTMFRSIGCASCHTPEVPLASSTYVLPRRSGGLFASDARVDLATEGATPRLGPAPADGTPRSVWLYSDLKRHDMGEALSDDRDDRGVKKNEFVTPPLWGVARSKPYMHDGRASDFDAAILAHGGEAQGVRDAYAALSDEGRAPVRAFLSWRPRSARGGSSRDDAGNGGAPPVADPRGDTSPWS
ncbi:MAG: di-heme oxidoredictase family protein [Polyangiaceae bacterium]